MFEIEKEIKLWREEMIRGGIKKPEVLDELESHLRTETQHQIETGHGAEKAFQNAVQKIGAPATLKNEFEKAGSTLARKRFTVLIAAIFSLSFAYVLVCLIFGLGIAAEMSLPQQRWGAAAILLAALLGWGGFFSSRFFPVVANEKKRDTLGVSAAVLMAVWAIVFFDLMLPRMELGIGPLFIALGWGFFMPLGLLLGLIGGLERAFVRRITATV
jgi:hypothetical protein